MLIMADIVPAGGIKRFDSTKRPLSTNVRLGSKGEVPDLLDQVRSDHDSGK
jgi:hypothetical protein